MRKYKLKLPVHRLNKTLVELSNGTSFTIVNDFKNMEGPINSFDAAFQSWLARTDDYTAQSFIKYVKSKEPERIFVTLEDYEAIATPASKDEFDAENN